MNGRGLTLTDLSAVLVIVLLFLAVTPALQHKATEASQITLCARNLKNIAAAMIEYSNKNNGKYPRTNFDEKSSGLTAYTGVNAADPFGPGGPQANDVSAPIWLLLRSSGMDPKVLVGGDRWNTSSLDSDFAIAADMNPGTPALLTVSPTSSTVEMYPANSQNHKGRGQNVLYGDYHVEFKQTPFCGSVRTPPGATAIPYQDNIYTSETSPPSVGGQPQDCLDTVMLPLSTAGLQPPVPMLHPSRWSVIAVVNVVLLVVGAIVVAVFIKRRTSSGTGNWK